WQVLFPPAKPTTPPPQPAQPAAPAAPSTQPTPAPAPAPTAATPTGAPGATAFPEREIELLTPQVRFVLSNRGGILRHAELRDPKFLQRKGDPSSGFDV